MQLRGANTESYPRWPCPSASRGATRMLSKAFAVARLEGWLLCWGQKSVRGSKSSVSRSAAAQSALNLQAIQHRVKNVQAHSYHRKRQPHWLCHRSVLLTRMSIGDYCCPLPLVTNLSCKSWQSVQLAGALKVKRKVQKTTGMLIGAFGVFSLFKRCPAVSAFLFAMTGPKSSTGSVLPCGSCVTWLTFSAA